MDAGDTCFNCKCAYKNKEGSFYCAIKLSIIGGPRLKPEEQTNCRYFIKRKRPLSGGQPPEQLNLI